MPNRICVFDGCELQVVVNARCATHHVDPYGRRFHVIVCPVCGVTAAKTNSRIVYCSRSCAQRARKVRGKRSTPLGRALDSGDRSNVLDAIRQGSKVDGDCWVWQGSLNRDGYPLYRLRQQSGFVHRKALECKIGRKLGGEQAHHICAKRSCVNPDHLQVASQAENLLEMKARQSLEVRVRELEQALRRVDPHNRLLSSLTVL